MKTYEQYHKYAKQLASKWRHSKVKIKEKLITKGANNIVVDKIIQSLEKEGVINDKKAFEIDVFIMEEKRYGYRRVKEYLLHKGYSKKLTDSYLYNKDIEQDNCYFQFVNAIKRYKNYKYSDVERQKLINALKRCGFNDKMIYEIVRAGINYENVM